MRLFCLTNCHLFGMHMAIGILSSSDILLHTCIVIIINSSSVQVQKL